MDSKLIKRLAAATMCAALAISMAACGQSEPETDPHEGMAYVNTGANWEWITPSEGVAVSSFTEEEFSTDAEGLPVYNGDKYDTRLGIDVSFYQGVIDWEAVAADGIEFAMIRCGYRGSETGEMVVDEQFENNIQGALDAGLDVGVYFFSQAVTVEEAIQEADATLDWIEGYDISFPVVFDWERISYSSSRTADTSSVTVTDCALAFCGMIEEAGYTAMTYGSPNTVNEDLYIDRLLDYPFWLAHYTTDWAVTDYPYHYDMWQYTSEGSVDGIEGRVDLNVCIGDIYA